MSALNVGQRKRRVHNCSKYSKADVLHLKSFFNKHDADGDGRVTIAELIKALEADRNMTRQELSAFRTMDVNRDGVLTFNEYLRRLYPFATEREFQTMLAWATPAARPQQEEPTFEPSKEQLEEIKCIFNMFDKDRNGVVSMEELVAVADRCGLEGQDMERMFRTSDKDNNGVISFDEFVQLMKVSYV